MKLEFGPRRAIYLDITDDTGFSASILSNEELNLFERYDVVYRALCAVLYNYVPTSGHPGGSISSGRMVERLLFNTMNYDFSNPDRLDADLISYAAGHKALGLYAMWALRNEIVRIGAPNLLPNDKKLQLRLEDLLGFRRNPTVDTPLVKKFESKALDGHPTPATPFLKLSTGASGVGIATSLGLAFAAKDYFGKNSPYVHIIEGEGGMTPGRVSESFASAGTSSLSNAIIHVDWNQASIDSDRVCRDGDKAGDYVQWNPMEFAYLHDWNVIYVPDGKDFKQVAAAQKKALEISNGQPTAIVYRTIKGWKYGIEGRKSHGAGHKMCSDGFYEAMNEFFSDSKSKLPTCDANTCKSDVAMREECYWKTLSAIRKELENDTELISFFASRISDSQKRLNDIGRSPRQSAPNVNAIYDAASNANDKIPNDIKPEIGSKETLRGALGKTLNYYNKIGKGAMLVASADLMNSTSASNVTKGFPEGFFNANSNALARALSVGGICEDAMSGILSGISSYGQHIGIGSSYGAFIAPLGHIASRLHAIGNQSRRAVAPSEPYKTFILINAHAGLKTGEDGPTHADPQPLQLVQENFPRGTSITLTPWDPQEIWYLVSAALAKRPAVIMPFVTRPSENIIDRESIGVAPASSAKTGVYQLIKANGNSQGSIVLQGSGVTYAFIERTLPMLKADGIELDVYYVASAELFDMLPSDEQERIFPENAAVNAMGITGFTLPTMYRWVKSEFGRAMTLYPFQKGHYLGSGQAEYVLTEAGLDGKNQFKAIMRYLKEKA